MEPVVRACKGCGEDKSLERFPLYSVDGKQYRRRHCRRCYRERRNASKRAGVCSQCGEAKAAHEFPGYGSRICFPCRRALGRARPQEERQGEKQRAAERKGKEYQSLDEYRRHLKQQQHQRMEERRREREARCQQRAVARKERLRALWSLDLHVPGMDETHARKKLGNAVQSGRIVKPKHCARCGMAPPRHRLHGHHEDYEYPLRVEWLCAACHTGCHGRAC